MNPLLISWLRWLGLIALEVGIIVGVASQLRLLTKSALWRRAIWHVCVLSVLALTICEFSGLTGQFSAWLHRPMKAGFIYPKSSVTDANSLPVAAPMLSERPAPPVEQLEPPIVVQPPVANVETHRPVQQIPSQNPIIAIPAVPNGLPANSHQHTPSETLWLLALMTVWLAGMAIVIGRMLCGRIALETFRWRNPLLADEQLCATVRVLACQLGIRRKVRLLESNHIHGPVAFGILRPTIALPTWFSAKFGAEERETMLAHELAHLAGNDPAWYLAADLLVAFFWWHPLVWWTRHRLQTDSELAADEASLLLANGPRVLAECLVAIGGTLARANSFRQMGVNGNGFRSSLGQRVQRLVTLEGAHWRPLNRLRGMLARTVGPLVLAGATIFCTAWEFPTASNQGDNMQIIKQTWKKSLTALALLTAFNSDNHAALAQDPPPDPPGYAKAQEAQAQVLKQISQGQQRYQAAEQKQKQAMEELDRQNSEIAKAEADLERKAAEFEKRGAEFEKDANPDKLNESLVKMYAQLDSMKMAQPGWATTIRGAPDSEERRALMAKLSKITLDNVHYENMPLGEVIKNLVQLSQERDPDKVGVNFVLNHEMPPEPPVPGAVDPTTGLPVAPPAMESLDLASVTVNINPPLKHVRLIDVLDVLTKVSDHPIKYSVEDYGVIISAGSMRQKIGGTFHSDSERLFVRTYKVDTNTFYAGLDRAFGVKINTNGVDDPKKIQEGLRQVLTNLGINMNVPNKSIFYNDVNGMLMVRATEPDLALVSATIETLGGSQTSSQPGGFGRGFFGVPGGLGGTGVTQQ